MWNCYQYVANIIYNIGINEKEYKEIFNNAKQNGKDPSGITRIIFIDSFYSNQKSVFKAFSRYSQEKSLNLIQCTGDDNKKKTNDLGVLFLNDTTRDLQSLFAKKIVAATVKAKQKMMDVEINQSNNDTCNLDKQKDLSKTTSDDQGQQLNNTPNSPCNQVNIIQSTSWNGNDCTNNNHSKSDF